MSPEFVPVLPLDALPPGHAKAVRVGQREVALFNVRGTLHALDDRCPHQGGPLHEGWIDEAGEAVACPWHAWCFRLRDGRMTLADLDGVDVFDVRVERGMIEVAVQPRAAADA